MSNKTILLKKSSVKDKTPDGDILQYGELALNYNLESVDLYTKNSDNKIVSLLTDNKFVNYYTGINKITASSGSVVLDPSKRINIVNINTNINIINLAIDSNKKGFGEIVCVINNKSGENVTINYNNISNVINTVNNAIENDSLYSFRIVYDDTNSYVIK